MNFDEHLLYYWMHMLDEAMNNKCVVEASKWREKRDLVAKKVKNDEWLTRIGDAAKLITPFANNLKGKKIYCNCNDP